MYKCCPRTNSIPGPLSCLRKLNTAVFNRVYACTYISGHYTIKQLWAVLVVAYKVVSTLLKSRASVRVYRSACRVVIYVSLLSPCMPGGTHSLHLLRLQESQAELCQQCELQLDRVRVSVVVAVLQLVHVYNLHRSQAPSSDWK